MSSTAPVACGRTACVQGPAWIAIIPRPVGVAVARQFTHSKLTAYGRDFTGDVELVVSELVTNAYEAICRAAEPAEPRPADVIRLGVQCAPRWVHLRVADPLPRPPARRSAAETEEHGRGLGIVGELAFWWVHARPNDKTVHAIVTVPDVVLTQYDMDRLASGL